MRRELSEIRLIKYDSNYSALSFKYQVGEKASGPALAGQSPQKWQK
jgi:hypothetical protein